MTEGVKSGQVWKHKNSGEQVTVDEDGGDWVRVVYANGRREYVRTGVLVDDCILVKDAP